MAKLPVSASAVVIACLLAFTPCGLSAQAKQPAVFEVASLKPVASGVFQTRPTRTPGRFVWTTQLGNLIQYAYHLEDFRISQGIPGYGSIYHLEAVTDPAATEDQVRLVVQALLRERFKLVTHLATREMDGYALMIAKDGPKIAQAKDGDKPPPLPLWNGGASIPDFEGHLAATAPGIGVVAVTGQRVSILQLAEMLQGQLRAMVWDQTGLAGNYYFGFRYAQDGSPDTDAPPLAVALREELGLTLEKQKGPVDVLVVDHIERTPTEN